MLKRALKMSFWVWYDYMGMWFFLNLCLIFPLILLIVPLSFYIDGNFSLVNVFFLLIIVLYFFITNVFVSAFVTAILEKKERMIEKIVFALKITIFKSIPVFILFLFIFAILFANIWFYANKKFFNTMYINYILIGIFIWFNLFTFLSLMWVIPSLSFKKMDLWRYFYWGYIILFANPYFSFQVSFWYTILWILNVFPVFFFFIGMVFPSIFLTCAYEILSRKYEALQTLGDKGEEYQIFRDNEDEFLNRGWEHFIKPWKM